MPCFYATLPFGPSFSRHEGTVIHALFLLASCSFALCCSEMPGPGQETGRRPCTELAATWSAGQALESGTTLDISGCVRASGRRAEVVAPALRDVRWERARCNDGSPFLFEVNMADDRSRNEWVIMLQGGFLCNDDQGIAPCAERSVDLSSSTSGPGDRDTVRPSKREGIFSLDAANNPTFSRMNHVFAHYCSSDLWTGTSTTPKNTTAGRWYFSGRSNVRAMIEVLISRYGLDDSDPGTKVLFMGQSAGGIGAIANVDQLISLLPRTAAGRRLKLISDGGGFVHFRDENHKLLGKMYLDDFAASNHSFFGSWLNPACEQAQQAQGKPPGGCLFLSVVYPSIIELGIPFFLIYSLHDAEMIDKHGIDPAADPEAYAHFGEVSRQDFEEIEWLFAGDQPYHMITTEDSIWNTELLGHTLNGVTTRFWDGGAPIRVVPDQ